LLLPAAIRIILLMFQSRFQSLARDPVAGDQLPDPFGEPDLMATLPPSKPVTGFVGIALFVVLALLLLAARSVVG
jgi:hypothetical protein